MLNYDVTFSVVIHTQKIEYKAKYNILVADKFGPRKWGCKISLLSQTKP